MAARSTLAAVLGAARRRCPAHTLSHTVRAVPRPSLRVHRATRDLTTASHTHDRSTHPSSSTDAASHAPTPNAAPDASTLLLLNALPHIAQYGFSKHAYLPPSFAAALDAAEVARRMRVVQTLFPHGPASFEASLFTTWNSVCDLSVVHGVPVDHVVQTLQRGDPVGARSQSKPVRMQGLSAAEERAALAKVVGLLEQRLRQSWAVRGHLTQGLTALCTRSPTTSTLHTAFPHRTLLPNLPDARPLLTLSSSFVATLLTHPSTQRVTGWIDPDGPEWYAVRTRLTLAYTAATLHMASGRTVHFQDTQQLLHRIVNARDSGLAATAETLLTSAKEWTRWGGRGWLGVFRSLGL